MKAFRFDVETAIEKKKTTEFKKLNSFTWIFLALILISILYFLFSPVIPELIYKFNLSNKYIDLVPYINHLSTDNLLFQTDNSIYRAKPSTNILYIPKIKLDAPIFEGLYESSLDLGLWHKPLSSNPEIGGNTVLTAHRFKNLNTSNIFFSLVELEKGDRYAIYWKGVEYDYEIYEKITVSNQEISIEYKTDNAISTLFTNDNNMESRLVIRGKLIGTY